MFPGLGLHLHAQYARRDGHKATEANTTEVINTLLKDSQRQWTRRRESITNIRMQAKLGASNLNNALPWREVKDPQVRFGGGGRRPLCFPPGVCVCVCVCVCV